MIAEAVTGVDARILFKGPRICLLHSALHAPQAGFGDFELHTAFIDMAAVLGVRLNRNRPLLSGNKRLTRGCRTMCSSLNGYELLASTEDAVSAKLAVAAGDGDEQVLAA